MPCGNRSFRRGPGIVGFGPPGRPGDCDWITNITTSIERNTTHELNSWGITRGELSETACGATYRNTLTGPTVVLLIGSRQGRMGCHQSPYVTFYHQAK